MTTEELSDAGAVFETAQAAFDAHEAAVKTLEASLSELDSLDETKCNEIAVQLMSVRRRARALVQWQHTCTQALLSEASVTLQTQRDLEEATAKKLALESRIAACRDKIEKSRQRTSDAVAQGVLREGDESNELDRLQEALLARQQLQQRLDDANTTVQAARKKRGDAEKKLGNMRRSLQKLEDAVRAVAKNVPQLQGAVAPRIVCENAQRLMQPLYGVLLQAMALASRDTRRRTLAYRAFNSTEAALRAKWSEKSLPTPKNSRCDTLQIYLLDLKVALCLQVAWPNEALQRHFNGCFDAADVGEDAPNAEVEHLLAQFGPVDFDAFGGTDETALPVKVSMARLISARQSSSEAEPLSKDDVVSAVRCLLPGDADAQLLSARMCGGALPLLSAHAQQQQQEQKTQQETQQKQQQEQQEKQQEQQQESNEAIFGIFVSEDSNFSALPRGTAPLPLDTVLRLLQRRLRVRREVRDVLASQRLRQVGRVGASLEVSWRHLQRHLALTLTRGTESIELRAVLPHDYPRCAPLFRADSEIEAARMACEATALCARSCDSFDVSLLRRQIDAAAAAVDAFYVSGKTQEPEAQEEDDAKDSSDSSTSEDAMRDD